MHTLVVFMLTVLSFLYKFTTKIGKVVRKYGGKEQNKKQMGCLLQHGWTLKTSCFVK